VLDQFVPPVDYPNLKLQLNKLSDIQFNTLDIQIDYHHVVLPSLEIFRKFIYGIAFYQGQVPDALIPEINNAMVDVYAEECQKIYQGTYAFNLHVYCIQAEK
jgi:hypothetical protein